MAQGVHVDPERLYKLSAEVGRFAEHASELMDAIVRDISARVKRLEQMYARALERSLREENGREEEVAYLRAVVTTASDLHSQLLEAARALRRTLDASVPIAQTHLQQLAADIEAFQRTPLPSEGTASAIYNASPAPSTQTADVSPGADQPAPSVCNIHQVELQPCPKCKGKGYYRPGFVNPERLFATSLWKEKCKEFPRCAACNGSGKYCPECAGASIGGENR